MFAAVTKPAGTPIVKMLVLESVVFSVLLAHLPFTFPTFSMKFLH